jgi:uncharacterized protein (TIGR00251 family)
VDKSTKISVRLTPRSSKDRFTGTDGEVIKINLTAPPVDGEANQSLVRFLAKALSLKASAITITQGTTSRTKTVEVRGYDQNELWSALEPLIAAAGKKDRAEKKGHDDAQR